MIGLALSPVYAGLSTEKRLPANMAVWILVWAEMTEFALFFLVFLIARSHQTEVFSQGPAQLNTWAGVSNTLVLLSSSYCVARAMHAIHQGRTPHAQAWFLMTIVMASCYLGIKFWEYDWNKQSGIHARTNLFFTLYYYLTFNHLLHVLVGVCTIIWAMFRLHLGHFSTENSEGPEGAANYWHMIDLVWILIFPLLYVLR